MEIATARNLIAAHALQGDHAPLQKKGDAVSVKRLHTSWTQFFGTICPCSGCGRAIEDREEDAAAHFKAAFSTVFPEEASQIEALFEGRKRITGDDVFAVLQRLGGGDSTPGLERLAARTSAEKLVELYKARLEATPLPEKQRAECLAMLTSPVWIDEVLNGESATSRQEALEAKWALAVGSATGQDLVVDMTRFDLESVSSSDS